MPDLTDGPRTRRQALAAVRQHFVLRAYRLRLVEEFATQDDYCNATGFDRSHLSRLLNGRLYMSYEDLASFDADLGPLSTETEAHIRDVLEQARFDIDERLREAHVNFVLPSPLTKAERALRGLSPKRVQIREPYTPQQRQTHRTVLKTASHGLALAVRGLEARTHQHFADPEVGVKLTGSTGAAGDFGQGHLIVNIDLNAYTWAKDVASGGHAVIDGRFVLKVDRTDRQGRPIRVRVLDVDEQPTDPQRWGTVADLPAAVEWTGDTPALIVSAPDQ